MSDGNPDRGQALKSLGGVATALILPIRSTKTTVPSILALACPSQPVASWTAAPPASMAFVSDRRLKRDIVRVGRLANGLPCYKFRYVSSSDIYVGVIAQEVLPVVPEAVIVGEDGYMRVDYARLGTRMMTWAEWQRNSVRARPKSI